MSETATERGNRIQAEAVKAARPVIRKQMKLALGFAGTLARDRAAGISGLISEREYVEAGLDRRIAEFVREGRFA